MKLASLFSDHMVLQRDRVVSVWGWDAPGTVVTLALAGRQAVAVAGADGKFFVQFPPMPAGGPHVLTACGTETRVVQDILVGEVWVGSGQSNMEWPVSMTDDAADAIASAGDYGNIRLFSVPMLADQVEPKIDLTAAWKQCDPASVQGFSAVLFAFGRMLHQKLGVPVGLINTSWGGTVAEAWTSREALQNEPTLRGMIDAYDHDLADHERARAAYEKNYTEWESTYVHRDVENKGVKNGWADPATSDQEWPVMDLPQLWTHVEGMSFSGVLWFRREVEVPASWAGRDLELSIGPIDKSDVTYFNGEQVGSITQGQNPAAWCTPRCYTVPGRRVKAGRNVVAVRAFSNMWGGGFGGKADQMTLSLKPMPMPKPTDADEPTLSLAGAWRYQVETNFGPISPAVNPPPPPMGKGNANSPTILFNNMIAPLLPYGIAGATWYQGESNADRPYQYRTLFQTMIRDWRQRWGQGDFPFLFVQLANFMPRLPEPRQSNWAELREAQTMALSLPCTGMATIIDIGDAVDIHPRNKKDVGERLCLWALANHYGFAGLVHSGPMYKSCVVEGSSVRVRFDHVGGGLVARGGGAVVKGFAVAGADRKFVWADAKIDGDTVVVSSPSVPAPVAVRYAWADNPDGNLYNTSGLPASPFRTDEWTGV